MGKARREKAKTDFTKCKSAGCANPLADGKRYCHFHLNKRRAKAKEWRVLIKEEGKCARCGRPLIDWFGNGSKNVTCSNCSEKIYMRHIWK
jgi:DNA-directed RNA polymerase subunit RPC12/RpoP